MAELEEIAGALPITISAGSSFSKLIDWDIDLTGYTFAATIYHFCGDNVETVITVTDTNLGDGKITLSLSATLVAALEKDVDHNWVLIWTVGGEPRSVLKGTFTVNS